VCVLSEWRSRCHKYQISCLLYDLQVFVFVSEGLYINNCTDIWSSWVSKSGNAVEFTDRQSALDISAKNDFEWIHCPTCFPPINSLDQKCCIFGILKCRHRKVCGRCFLFSKDNCCRKWKPSLEKGFSSIHLSY